MKTEKSEIVKGLIDGLRLSPAYSNIPLEVANSIQPVFVSNERGKLRIFTNDTANENSKTITVPAGKKWKILYARGYYTSDATVGNRNVCFEILDNSNVAIWTGYPPSSQAASLSVSYYWSNGLGTSITVATGRTYLAAPGEIIIPENCSLKFSDISNISATDDIVLKVCYIETSMEA